MSFLDRNEFIALAKSPKVGDVAKQKALADAAVRKEFAVEAAVDTVARTVKFTITTGDVDRDNDVINPMGWDISDYVKAPVVLWAHDHKQPPIARALDVTTAPNGLVSTAQFPDEGVYPFADMIFNLVKGGFIRAASVGFKPDEYSFDDDRHGVNFQRQSLLEWSIVPVPANANALLAASAEGVDIAPLRKWMADLLAADWPGGLKLPGKAWKNVIASIEAEVEPKAEETPAGDGARIDALDAKMTEIAASVASIAESVTALQSSVKEIVEASAAAASTETEAAAAAAASDAGAEEIVFIIDDDESASDDEPTFTVDPDEIRAALSENIKHIFGELAVAATRKAINQVRGRVD